MLFVCLFAYSFIHSLIHSSKAVLIISDVSKIPEVGHGHTEWASKGLCVYEGEKRESRESKQGTPRGCVCFKMFFFLLLLSAHRVKAPDSKEAWNWLHTVKRWGDLLGKHNNPQTIPQNLLLASLLPSTTDLFSPAVSVCGTDPHHSFMTDSVSTCRPQISPCKVSYTVHYLIWY